MAAVYSYKVKLLFGGAQPIITAAVPCQKSFQWNLFNQNISIMESITYDLSLKGKTNVVVFHLLRIVLALRTKYMMEVFMPFRCCQVGYLEPLPYW